MKTADKTPSFRAYSHEARPGTTTTPPDPPVRLIGPRAIRRPHEATAAANALADRLMSQFQLPGLQANLIDNLLFELAHNAVTHGAPPASRPEARIAVTHRRAADVITIRVTDRGPGIPATLRRTAHAGPAPREDPPALLYATYRHVSSTDHPLRGCGLSNTLTRALGQGNTLTIASGAAVLHVPDTGPPAVRPAPNHGGTDVRVTISLLRLRQTAMETT